MFDPQTIFLMSNVLSGQTSKKRFEHFLPSGDFLHAVLEAPGSILCSKTVDVKHFVWHPKNIIDVTYFC